MRVHSTSTILRRGGIGILAAALACAVAVPAASAATKRPAAPVIATADGTVGTPQSVLVSVPSAAGTTVAVQVSLGGVPQFQQPVSLNAQGGGGFTWTPTKAGAWAITGVGAQASATVAAVPTRTTAIAPNQTPTSTGTVLGARVDSVTGYLPAGVVTFTNAFTGEVLGVAPVGGTSTGTATGWVAWTPSSPAGYRITATYASADGSAGRSSATASSQVLANGPVASLLVPSSLRYGEPTTIVTRINNTLLQGGVATWVNVNGAITQLPQKAGVIEQESAASWTPSVVGNQLLNSAFSPTNSSITGSAVQWVSVQPTRTADPMSVLVGGQGPLTAGASTTVSAGSRTAVVAATGSTAPASFTVGAPCYLTGSTLVAPAKAATCTLTASSPGAGAYGPNGASFTVVVAAKR